MKKTIVFDFDGVIHKYSKGWQNGVIYDSPNKNIKECIKQLRENNYEVVIVSTRCNTDEGIEAIKTYLKENDIEVDKICKEKPPASVYVDDRAVKYDPLCIDLYNIIINEVPYQDSQKQYAEAGDLKLLYLLNAKNKEFQELNNEFDKKYKDDNIDLKERGIINLNLLDDWINALKKYL